MLILEFVWWKFNILQYNFLKNRFKRKFLTVRQARMDDAFLKF